MFKCAPKTYIAYRSAPRTFSTAVFIEELSNGWTKVHKTSSKKDIFWIHSSKILSQWTEDTPGFKDYCHVPFVEGDMVAYLDKKNNVKICVYLGEKYSGYSLILVDNEICSYPNDGLFVPPSNEVVNESSD
jgi:hypothetical protein